MNWSLMIWYNVDDMKIEETLTEPYEGTCRCALTSVK
jgi:hypothetical protein